MPTTTWGKSVASAGDFNGDGIEDLLLGSQFADPQGRDYAGAAFVVYGNRGGLGNLNLGAMTAAQGFRIDGARPDDITGGVVESAGDVNGDGLGDLLIGASSADPGGLSNAGSAYIVFGRQGGYAGLDLATLTPAQGVRVDGVAASQRIGSEMSSADINGDGLSDVMFGVYNASYGREQYEEGATFVIYGRQDGAMGVNLLAMTAEQGFRIDGSDFLGKSGQSVEGLGDVNGDGVADLLIGAPNEWGFDHLPFNQQFQRAGHAYVVYGRGPGLEVTGGPVGERITGGGGPDRLNGLGGDDLLIGGEGADVLDGGAGDDRIEGGGGGDVLIGQDGADVMFGEGGADHFYGGDGDDRLFGAGETADDGVGDVLEGNGGNDRLTGGAGDDWLVGGDGDDVLLPGAGLNQAIGGGGNDVLSFEAAAGGVWADIAHSIYSTPDNWTVMTSIEGLFGGSGADNLFGDAGANLLRGGGGFDVLVGRSGDDRLFGEGGDDWLEGGAGSDRLSGGVGLNHLNGGDGQDYASYETAATGIWADLSVGFYSAPGVWDVFNSIEGLIGSSHADTLFGGAGGDGLNGGGGADSLFGREGDDFIEGGDGGDLLIGEAGDDWLLGGDGADRMIGGAGTDVMVGGAGADVFDLGGAGGWDIARDFSLAEDRVSLGGWGFNTLAIGDFDGDGQADDSMLTYAGGTFVVWNVAGPTLADWNGLLV
jgi:Ca2+-binding RTX toxin-like protein